MIKQNLIKMLKKTKDYDLEAPEKKPQNNENYEKKEFKNQKLNDGKEDNFVKLNTKEDLYLKNLKEKGLDKEIIEENKGDEKKRKFNNNNQRTFYNKRDFKKKNHLQIIKN